MKLAGALLAFLGCCCAAGAVRGVRRPAQTGCIAALCEALCLMKSELGTRLSTIPGHGGARRGRRGALRRTSSRRFPRAWTRAWPRGACAIVGGMRRGGAVRACRAEAREFAALGVLGRCDADMQLAAISACEAYLRAALERARGDYPQQRRLSLGIAAAAGALLVIVFI